MAKTTALEKATGQVATKAKAPGLPVNEVLALRLREARQARGVSQAVTVRELEGRGRHMLRSTLAKIELGARDTSVPELIALAEALDVSPAFLLTPPPGQQLWVSGTTDKPVALSPEATWAWFGGERLRPDGWDTLLPEHEAKRREEDEILAQAEQIRAQRAQKGEKA
jgi:transcriptional regulator with XRE-family HTH domain